ncbi:restriction endonuclease subunit S [Campylobacter upsaliensis]|nr:restriction endonuclease subunit S [Campylobacter upsaliensis]
MKKHTQSPYESSKVSYKPSGIKWLGEIPQGWEIKKLKYIGEIFGGVTGKTIKDFSKEYKLNFKPYITFTNVCNNAVINPDLMEYVFIDSKEKQNKVLKNDILFLQSSETFEDVGKSAIYLNDDEVYLNTFCKGFRIEREAYPMYLNYLLSSLSYKRYFMSVCSGFTRINLRQEHFLDIPLILPPLQEQKEIAEFLDKKCEKIQNYINKKQKLITLLQEKKQALINEAVCGRVACHTERSEVSTTAYKPSGIEYLGLIPHHWEVKKLKHICKINPQANETLPNNFVYIDLESVIKGQLLKEQVINKEQAPSRAQRILQKQDILFQLVRPYQRNNYIFNKNGDYVASTGYAQIRTKECVNFVYYALLENSFVERVILKSTGSNYPAITSNDFADLKIPLPPLQEQKQIANFLDEKCEKINSVIEKTKKQIELVKEYKNTLINEAVCGRINLERK